MAHSPFDAAFKAGTRFIVKEGQPPAEVNTRVLGELEVPTGKLCACDPFTTSFEPGDPPSFNRVTPTGRFPVELSLLRFPDGDTRVACARVRFAPMTRPAVRWELAVYEGETLTPHSEASYGVDAGTGCFFDEAARAPQDEATTQAWLAAHERTQVNTWSWHLPRHGAANIATFSSGLGDGFYSSYWGFDLEGELVELVTDFDLLVVPVTERAEFPLPLPRGKLSHPSFDNHDLALERPWLSSSTVIVSGRGTALVRLSDGTPLKLAFKSGKRVYTWRGASVGAQLIVDVVVGDKAAEIAAA